LTEEIIIVGIIIVFVIRIDIGIIVNEGVDEIILSGLCVLRKYCFGIRGKGGFLDMGVIIIKIIFRL
jgi:hypothetical protein